MRKTSIYENYAKKKSLRGRKKYYNKIFKRETSIIQDGQAKKSAGRMPWHWEPTKDVVSCDKLRGIASIY